MQKEVCGRLSINVEIFSKYLEHALPVIHLPCSSEPLFLEKVKNNFTKTIADCIGVKLLDCEYYKLEKPDADLFTNDEDDNLSIKIPLHLNDKCYSFKIKFSKSGLDILGALFLFQLVVFETRNSFDCREENVEIIGLPDEVITLARRAATSSLPCLILGETGVGKEVIAEAIHRWSGRKGPFVAVNCGAIPHGLFENELFGHEPNSFTGSSRSGLAGKIEIANGGTLFLDEVGEIPLYSQAKLLRVIERREFWKLGAVRPTAVDVKIIAATNKPLKELIKLNRFRKDLYYRLKGIEICVPPLRERGKKIDELIFYFLSRFGHGRVKITEEALELMRNYHWPGNVRELMYLLQLLCEELKDGVITKDRLGKHLGQVRPCSTFYEARKIFEKEFILKSLEQNNWNVTRTASAIKMSRRWLQLKMREFGIEILNKN